MRSFFQTVHYDRPSWLYEISESPGTSIAVGGVAQSYSYTQCEYHGVRCYGHLIDVKSQKVNGPKRKIIKRNKSLWQKLHLTDVHVAVYCLEILYDNIYYIPMYKLTNNNNYIYVLLNLSGRVLVIIVW